MTLNEFNRMRLAQKSDLVWESAFYITNTRYGNYNAVIFALSDFFVEVFINVAGNKTELIKGISIDELHKDDLYSIPENNPFVKLNEALPVKFGELQVAA